MRTPCFAALLCLALSACDREPTFDASSLPAYQKSLGVIKTRLDEKDRHKLQLALLTLAAGSSADYTAFALANSDAPANVEALDGIVNPLNVLDRMRPSIAGKTAAAVIRHVADDLDSAIVRTEGQADGAEKVLAAFVIENPQYSWSQRSRTNQWMLEFSIYNGSKEPISGILVTATLTTPDYDAPLMGSNVNYHFTNPLQPGAQQRVEVALGAPGPWTAKQIEAADTTLRLKVSNIFKVNGRRLLAADVGWLDVIRKKRNFLRGS
jgi:hypothetical protein